jgi:hypothetical protein
MTDARLAPRPFDRAALVLALGAAAAIVLGAPYIGQVRSAIQAALPGQYRVVVAGVVAVLLAAAIGSAAVRIRERRRLRYGALGAALVLGAIYARAISTGNPDQDLVEQFHFVEFGLLTFLFRRVWASRRDATALVLAFCAAVLVGIVDEWVQWFIPSRVGELRDVLINAAAAVSGVLFAVGVEPPRSFALPAHRTRELAFAGTAVVIAAASFVDAVHLGHRIDESGVQFRSRWTAERLRDVSSARPPGAAEQPGGAFAREDHYLSEARWHVLRRNEAAGDGDLRTAWHENLILERFYAPVLQPGTVWPPEQRANTQAVAASDSRPFVSDAEPYRILTMPRWQLWLAAAGIVAALWTMASRRRPGVAVTAAV